MKTKWLGAGPAYDGTQLRSLYGYLEHGVLGDSIVAWSGPCDIPFEHMVDGEDLLAQAQICSQEMVHFIIEKFDSTLLAAVSLQRLLAAIVMDIVRELSSKDMAILRREGDDVFFGTDKLSISIATQSPVSSLIHFAVNITTEGTPVPTTSLQKLGIAPDKFALRVLEKFSEEVETIIDATRKVRWVK